MKKWKIILSILLVLIIGTAGTAYYFLKIKDYHTADKEVDKIMESDYTIKLPGPDDEIANNDENETNEPGITNSGENTGTDPTNHSDANKTDNPDAQSSNETDNNIEEKISASAIKARYRPSFEALQSQANGKINALVGRAFSEYQAKKSNEEHISYSYFYSKYTSAGEALESKTNAAFNTIYGALVNELEENGYSASEAQEFQDQYESMKKQRRQSLIKTALSKR